MLLEMMKQMILTKQHGYNPHRQPPFSNGTMANINDILLMEAVTYQNYSQMKVKHTSELSVHEYLSSWMIK